MVHFEFLWSLFVLFCCYDTTNMRPCSTYGIGDSHSFPLPDVRRPLPLKSQWWCSWSARPPSTINLTAMTWPHWVHLTNQACQACLSNSFSNQHANSCEPVPYFLSDSLYQIHYQVNLTDKVCQAWPSSHFGTNTPSNVIQNYLYYHITCPSKAIF